MINPSNGPLNIVMMTNTYLPHVGGVARSVETFARACRERGHRVLIVAPEFKDATLSEVNVVRIPAIQNFNGSDFSMVLPMSAVLRERLDAFRPDIVHSHHPFLLGSTAVRIAARYGIPLVFTHHTMYERYTHYVPGNSRRMQRFVIELATQYANLCHQVIAPSSSIAEIIQTRGVKTPISVIPTGVDVECFGRGDGEAFRRIYGIPLDCLLLGHLGRLAEEKNLDFLAKAAIEFMRAHSNSYFILIGSGPSKEAMVQLFCASGLEKRLVCAGTLELPLLASAYRAMDVFLFTSFSETQGMVVSEAMAAGVPVIALNAPGVREVVRDNHNAWLLPADSSAVEFALAISAFAQLNGSEREAMSKAAMVTAERFSIARSVDSLVAMYQQLRLRSDIVRNPDNSAWSELLPLIQSEWHLFRNLSEAASAAFRS